MEPLIVNSLMINVTGLQMRLVQDIPKNGFKWDWEWSSDRIGLDWKGNIRIGSDAILWVCIR
jgi:hypothetical protein